MLGDRFSEAVKETHEVKTQIVKYFNHLLVFPPWDVTRTDIRVNMLFCRSIVASSGEDKWLQVFKLEDEEPEILRKVQSQVMT